MTAEEANQLIAILNDIRKVSIIDRAAWMIVLKDWTFDAAIDEISRVRTRQRFIDPCDLNPDTHELEWGAAWAIYSRHYPRLQDTAGADYGHPTINAVAAAMGKQIAYMSASDARWAFRDAFEAATSPASPEALTLAAGRQTPELAA